MAVTSIQKQCIELWHFEQGNNSSSTLMPLLYVLLYHCTRRGMLTRIGKN